MKHKAAITFGTGREGGGAESLRFKSMEESRGEK